MKHEFTLGSVEFQGLDITRNGNRVTTFEVAVMPRNDVPTATDWVANVVLGDEVGFMVDGQAKGVWRVWVHVQDDPEDVILSCGTFVVK